MTCLTVKQYGVRWLVGWPVAKPAKLRGNLELTPQLLRLAWRHRRDVELRAWHDAALSMAIFFSNGDQSKFTKNREIATTQWTFERTMRGIRTARQTSNRSSDGQRWFCATLERHRALLNADTAAEKGVSSLHRKPATDRAAGLVRVFHDTGTRFSKVGEKGRERAHLAEALGTPKTLAGPTTRHECDEMFAALYAESPWLAPALTYLWRAAITRVDRIGCFGLPPVVLTGPPGCGKTYLAERIGTLSECTSLRLDMTGATSGFAVAGAEYTWSSSGPGRPIRHIADSGVANPVIVIDELDKRGVSTNGGDAAKALLPMLEPSTAAAYQSPYLEAVVDLSHVSWIICVNDVSQLPQPLLDRTSVLSCDMPDGDHLRALVRRILGDEVEAQIVDMATDAVRRGRSLRWLHRLADQMRAVMDAPMLM